MRYVSSSLLAGQHLSTLLKTIDYHIDVIETIGNKLATTSLIAHRDTVSLLIDRGQTTGNPDRSADGQESSMDPVYMVRHKEAMYMNRLLQAFWQGYADRCHHWYQRCLEMHSLGKHNR